jgi:hypothetical protein
MSSLWDRGLNLLNADENPEAELDAFRQAQADRHGFMPPGLDVLLEHRPDALKRFRLAVAIAGSDVCSELAMLHAYVVSGFETGIGYMIHSARTLNATKAQVLETIAVAFLHAGPRGLHAVAASADDLRAYEDPPELPAFPPGWAPDADAFRSGMDFSTTELTQPDLEALEAWYQRVCGEVPRHVRFLARHQPALLKASRGRFEHAIRDALPKQMLPYIQLHWNATRGNADGIREWALVGRGFGMRPEQAVHAIARALCIDGGPAAVDVAARELEPILADWD